VRHAVVDREGRSPRTLGGQWHAAVARRTTPLSGWANVMIGPDGKPRCAWAGTGDSPPVRYHDKVWGTRTRRIRSVRSSYPWLFQAGLSWEIVFGKRDAFQKVFHGFDVAKDIRSELRARCAASPDAPMIQLNTAPRIIWHNHDGVAANPHNEPAAESLSPRNGARAALSG
jgi:DNA-3-methyladenine glycosylase I